MRKLSGTTLGCSGLFWVTFFLIIPYISDCIFLLAVLLFFGDHSHFFCVWNFYVVPSFLAAYIGPAMVNLKLGLSKSSSSDKQLPGGGDWTLDHCRINHTLYLSAINSLKVLN